MSPEKQLNFWLAVPTVLFLIIVGIIPVIWPIMSKYEGKVLPVVKNVEVDILEKSEDSIIISVVFDKVRACEFIGISWYDSFGDRLPILFTAAYENKVEGTFPKTRPAIPGQSAGPWKLIGVDKLDGSMSIVSHRCHPLWLTYTRFY